MLVCPFILKSGPLTALISLILSSAYLSINSINFSFLYFKPLTSVNNSLICFRRKLRFLVKSLISEAICLDCSFLRTWSFSSSLKITSRFLTVLEEVGLSGVKGWICTPNYTLPAPLHLGQESSESFRSSPDPLQRGHGFLLSSFITFFLRMFMIIQLD